MTREEYDKIVEPVAPFEEIEKKQKPKTIDKYVEDVWGHELSKYQRDFITAIYEYHKANPFSTVAPCVLGNSMTNIMPFLAVVFAAYEENELY